MFSKPRKYPSKRPYHGKRTYAVRVKFGGKTMQDLVEKKSRLESASALGRPKPRKAFRKDIQGLRMVAVVAVILDHLLGWPSGGFVGVDVFFVISGFLITGLLLREHERSGSISFSAFYRNRIRRIAPAAVLVLLVTALAAWLFFNKARFFSVLFDALWAFLFTANWNHAAQGVNYFEASGPESPLQHFWSLAVEEQFYFIWPWLMLLVFVVVGRWRSLHKANARHAVGFVMIGICIASFIWSLNESANSPTFAYFSTFSRAWELGIGALVAVFSETAGKITSHLRQFMVYAGLGGIVLSLFVINEASAFPGPWAALPVISTAAVIMAGCGEQDVRIWPLTNPVAGYIGNISYSLYLWHFPVIIFYTTLVGESALDLAVCAVIFVLAAIYSFHLVEDPIRKSTWLLNNVKRKRNRYHRETTWLTESYKLTALSLLAVLTASSFLYAWTPKAMPESQPIAALPKASDSEDLEKELPELEKLQAEIRNALEATSWPVLEPAFDAVIGGPQAPVEISRCSSQVVEAACTWGDPNARHTIVTVGNSISMTYVAAIRAAVGTSDNWRIISYGMFGCQLGSKEDVASKEIIPPGCLQRADQAIDAINRIKPDVVVVAGAFLSASEEVERVSSSTKFVFMPGPPADKDIAACYTKVSVPADCVSTVPQGWAKTDRTLATSVKDGIFIDTEEWFCYERACPSFVGSIPVKLDIPHMTAAYAERLGPVIREKFEEEGIM